jgi:signal peptidase I
MRFRRKDKESVIYRWFGSTLGAFVAFFLEIVQVMVIAAAIIIPVRYFLVQPFIVKGASMEPNFSENDYLIIDQVTYRVREIERGEIVVFHPPGNEGQFYIKRVIGLPGETVEILNGRVTISNAEYPNGLALAEDYIDSYTNGHVRVTLGLDEYYLLGDNRDSSLDSRSFGAVKEGNILGKVWLRGLPLESIGTVATPVYAL